MNRSPAPIAEPIPSAGVPASAAWGVVVCLCLFAILRSRPTLIPLAGSGALLGAALAIAYGIQWAGDRWRDAFGWRRPRSHAGGWLAVGLLLGIFMGIAYRTSEGLPPWPAGLGLFAGVAATIGAVEELLYRGFVQSGLRGGGRFAGVVFAAAGHTAYKCLLFAGRPEATTDFGYLAVATFLAGILLGYVREITRSIAPPVLAHAAFDILVYGALSQAPWWVWG